MLALINANFPTGPLPSEVMHAVIARPAYWSLCWGSGIALARRLLDNPRTVRGLKVADIGCGSGVVGIAAKLAGAAEVWVCDNDPDALCATAFNGQSNGVSMEYCDDLARLPNDFDVLLMADVLYDRANFSLLDIAKAKGRRLIVADSRVDDVEDPDFTLTGRADALTFPNLGEFDEFRHVRFFEAAWVIETST